MLGVWVIYTSNTKRNVDFYDDYAHHPTEIKEVLDGVKKVYKDYEKNMYFSNHIEYQD